MMHYSTFKRALGLTGLQKDLFSVKGQEELSMAISWLTASGIHANMESDIQTRVPASWTMPTDIKLVPLSLNNLIMPFFIFLGGVSMAIIAFVIEKINQKRNLLCPHSKSVSNWRGIGLRAKHAWTNVGDI